MRSDMHKVIVERPRMRRGDTAYRADARVWRNSEEVPHKIGIKKGYTDRKWLNENLAPLKRFLRSQIGRPWDKVMGELRNGIDRRNAVQDHIFTHIDNYVITRAQWHDGEILVPRWDALEPLGEARAEMYVHPRTGILLENRARLAHQRKRRAAHEAEYALAASQRKTLADGTQLRVIDGQWYALHLARLPVCGCSESKTHRCDNRVFDFLLKQKVCCRDGLALRKAHGRADVYVQSKRQLSAAEVRKHGLAAPIRSDSA